LKSVRHHSDTEIRLGEGPRRLAASPKANGRFRPRVISAAVCENGSGKRMESAKTRRIAVLDDDQSIGLALGRLLRTSNIEATPYVTCIELFNAVAQSTPDCLILDLQMPGMNGLDVMQYFASKGIRLPTIIITAHDEASARQSCLAAGAKAYLRKPLDAEELFRAIELASEVNG
jgi:FixJ family two-component response regulator